jgi:hypothetical protein
MSFFQTWTQITEIGTVRYLVSMVRGGGVELLLPTLYSNMLKCFLATPTCMSLSVSSVLKRTHRRFAPFSTVLSGITRNIKTEINSPNNCLFHLSHGSML